MKTYITILTCILLTSSSFARDCYRRSRCNNNSNGEVAAAIIGFVIGAAASNRSSQYYSHQPRGCYKTVYDRHWIPGYYENVPSRCGGYTRVWRCGRWHRTSRRIWVNY